MQGLKHARMLPHYEMMEEKGPKDYTLHLLYMQQIQGIVSLFFFSAVFS